MRTRDGALAFSFESGVHIVDDVLQEEVSRARGDMRMKRFVSTIWQDQSAIIRNDDAHTLIIQGVASSFQAVEWRSGRCVVPDWFWHSP